MRHKVYGKHLSRSSDERKRLFRNLARSLILWEKIETTQSKAKAIRGFVDKLVKLAKNPATKRLVYQYFNTKESDKLINDITPRLKSRTSGYTSTTKIGKRLGDGAMMVQMRLLIEESTADRLQSTAKKKAIDGSRKTVSKKNEY